MHGGELDYREANNCIITVNMEYSLHHELTWNENAGWPYSFVIRINIENFLRGIMPKHRTDPPSDYFAQPLKYQMSSWLPKSFYDTIYACAKANGKPVSAIVRVMLREMFWTVENPYHSFLRKKYAEIAAKDPKAYPVVYKL